MIIYPPETFCENDCQQTKGDGKQHDEQQWPVIPEFFNGSDHEKILSIK